MFNIFKPKKIPLTELFPTNFVDIHTHLLPGIDDGAKNMKDSIALIKRMHGYGIKNFICTPHIMEGVWENSKENILAKLAELKEELVKQGLNDITIHAAAEYLLDANFSTLLKNKDLLTIKDTYILVELSYINAPINLYKVLFDIQIAGYKPILAHPERYSYFHNNFDSYLKLKEAGCLFQLNLLSLSNYYGKEVSIIAKKLLKNRLIDFVGSDTHQSRHLNYLESIDNTAIVKSIEPILKNNALFTT